MKVFLPGATGFVGSHVARAYADAGAELRLLTRKTSRLAAIEGLAAEVVVGDLRQPELLRTAMRGCDALVHVAADYRLWVRDPKEMYAANVDGTRELLRLAREEGVAKVVYTSSVATMGFKVDGSIVDEVDAGLAGRDDRAVQTVEVHGRAGGDPGGARGAACDDGTRRRRLERGTRSRC